METIESTTTLVVLTCGKCGTMFAIQQRLREELLQSHETFYCPIGHPRAYNGKSETEKLEEQLANARKRIGWAETAAQAARDQAQTAEHRRRAQKAVTTRIKNRIARGVCPCCNRNFENLKRHMDGQHPDFVVHD